MTAKINNLPVRTARVIAEITNATHFRTAECLAWAFDNVDLEREVRCAARKVSLWVIPGYGDDHLFDRAAARIIDTVDGHVYESVSALRDAVYSVRHECRVGCEITEAEYDYERRLPSDLKEEADAIRAELNAEKKKRQEAVWEKEAKAAAKKAAKRRPIEAKKLLVARGEDGVYRVTTGEHAKSAKWIDLFDGTRRWDAYGVDGTDAFWSDGSIHICSGCSRYGTEEEAKLALAAILAAV